MMCSLQIKRPFTNGRNRFINVLSALATCTLLSTSAGAAATDDRANSGTGMGSATGSTAFCLYEIPQDEFGRRRWINLGIVQYIEAKDLELKIYYGGGSFGSGYEAKINLAKPDDVLSVIEKVRKTAAACK